MSYFNFLERNCGQKISISIKKFQKQIPVGRSSYNILGTDHNLEAQ